MGDIALLLLGCAGAIWCAFLVWYAVSRAERHDRDLLAGMIDALNEALVAAGRRKQAHDAKGEPA